MKAKIFIAVLAAAMLAPAVSARRPAAHTNPVMRQHIPDPSVIKADDGFWYMMSTTTAAKGTIPLYRSTNLVDWTKVNVTDAMGGKGGDVNLTTVDEYDIWSPKMFFKNGKYLMFYSVNAPERDIEGQSLRSDTTTDTTADADTDPNNPYDVKFDERGKYIGWAVADHPAGPWTDKGKLFDGYDYENVETRTTQEIRTDEEGKQVTETVTTTVTEPGSRTVDPFYFMDDAGQEYLFWGNNHNLYGMEISIDEDFQKVSFDLQKKVKLGGVYMASITLYKHVDAEGKVWYYMFASQGEQGWNSSSVVVGRCDTPLGEYRGSRDNRFLDGGTVTIASKVISFDKEKYEQNPESYKYIGCGHPSRIITDEKGDTWFFCHGSDASDQEMKTRMPFLCKVEWKKDETNGKMWPELSGHYPLPTRDYVPAILPVEYPHGIDDTTIDTPLADQALQNGSIFDVFLLGDAGMEKLNSRTSVKLNDYRVKGTGIVGDRTDVSQWPGGNLHWAQDEIGENLESIGDGKNFSGFTIGDNNDRNGNGDKDNAGWSSFYVDIKDPKDLSHIGEKSRVHIVLRLQNDIVPPYVNVRWFSQGNDDRNCPQFSLSDYVVSDYKIQEWAPVVGSLVKGASAGTVARVAAADDISSGDDQTVVDNKGWVAIDMSLPEIADKMKQDYNLDMDYTRFRNGWTGHALEITLPSGFSIDDERTPNRGYGANLYVDGAYVYTPHAIVNSLESVSSADDIELVMTSDYITVLGSETTGVELYSLSGQLVRSSSTPVIATGGLLPGIYMVKTASAVRKVTIR